jgi:hypothetical protein
LNLRRLIGDANIGEFFFVSSFGFGVENICVL